MRKPDFCICENKTQIRRSAPLFSLHGFFLNPNFKPLAIFSDCAVRFVSDKIANPEDRFSHNEAHIYSARSIDQLEGPIFAVSEKFRS